MATFVLIHGAGDVGWYWTLVERELRKRGHDTLAPDLPCDDDSAGLAEYADTVVNAIGGRRGLVVVAQSFGGFTAPLVADRVPVDMLVLVAGMIPAPGEAPGRLARKYRLRQGHASAGAAIRRCGPDLPRCPPGLGRAGPPQVARPVRHSRPRLVATRGLAAGADPVRALHRRPVLPRRSSCAGSSPIAWALSRVR